ncbi:hypothetical protein PFISCL1PPCAC_2778 [Pristionchus fissidentatus]|uniref:Ankyrin repeat-containing protein n=1 Tax=Pristionchus fissidentatus TaxID=1538716 RepID=A0AAV5UYA4_9BILA|nr:hypothetical protein PFISCL1PPCAC_2778 [Pristionchus fissidentatus]
MTVKSPKSSSSSSEDELVSRVAALTMEEKAVAKREYLRPADFRALQSIRSTTLAGKIKTAKQCRSYDVMDDLRNHVVETSTDGVSDAEARQQSSSEEEEDPLLLERGPVMKPKKGATHHPYNNDQRHQHPQQVRLAPIEAIFNCSTYLDSLNPYFGTVEYRHDAVTRPCDEATHPVEHAHDTTGPTEQSSDNVPDHISDFILAYSREASTPRPLLLDTPPVSVESCISEQNPTFASLIPANRPAKQRLRAHLGEARINASMLQFCRALQTSKQLVKDAGFDKELRECDLIYWTDDKGNTLLHTSLMYPIRDIAQAYTIVEQHLRQESSKVDGLPWDYRNSLGESALWWAVVMRNAQFVDYLLELGADPNVQSTMGDGDSALHLAAKMGLTDIVKVLLRDPRTEKEVEVKSKKTPLLTAVVFNNVRDVRAKENYSTVEVVKTLLKAGTNPSKVDKRGDNIFHLAAQRCDDAMLEALADCLADERSIVLANQKNDAGESPLEILAKQKCRIGKAHYRKCFLALLTCNARAEGGESDIIEVKSIDEKEITVVDVE